MIRMKAMAAIVGLTVCSVVHADYSIIETGTWPSSWPKELEPLRKQSRTLEGPLASNQHYAIRFTKREDFEAAWPHILKLKSKEARLVLVRGPNFFLGENAKAGIVVHCPPVDRPVDPANPVAPVGKRTDARGSLSTTYIELIVDGDIVDLNRVPLPADTPIVDERFKIRKNT